MSQRLDIAVTYDEFTAPDRVKFEGDFFSIASFDKPVSPGKEDGRNIARCTRIVSGESTLLAHAYSVDLSPVDSASDALNFGSTYRASGYVTYNDSRIPVFCYNRAELAANQMEDMNSIHPAVTIDAVGVICDVKTYRSRFLGCGVTTEITLAHENTVGEIKTFLGRYLVDESVCHISSRDIFQNGCRTSFIGELDGISPVTGEMIVKVKSGLVVGGNSTGAENSL